MSIKIDEKLVHGLEKTLMMEKLDGFRDQTTYINFAANFEGLSITPKLEAFQAKLFDKLADLEKREICNLLDQLTSQEIAEWRREAENYQ